MTARRMHVDDLLSKCLQGDPVARNDFVGRYAPIIYSTVRRVVHPRLPGDPSIGIEDITQQVFLRLFRNDASLLHSYDPARASLATWLTIVARSTVLDALRKKKLATVPFEPAAHSPIIDVPEPPGGGITIPDGLLSPRQRLVMQLLYDRELEVREAAKILGIGEQTVRSTKHKALNKLRAFFGQSGKEAKG